jgi:hypothetical protein
MSLLPRIAAALAVLLGLTQPLATLAAGNSKVYRCGQTYQQTPCPAGQAVDVKDERDAGQQADAKKTLAADKALAKDLAAERREREKSVKPQTHAPGVPVSQPGPAASSAKQHDADPCKTKGGKHSKGKVKCVDGAPVYTVPAAPKGQ